MVFSLLAGILVSQALRWPLRHRQLTQHATCRDLSHILTDADVGEILTVRAFLRALSRGRILVFILRRGATNLLNLEQTQRLVHFEPILCCLRVLYIDLINV